MQPCSRYPNHRLNMSATLSGIGCCFLQSAKHLCSVVKAAEEEAGTDEEVMDAITLVTSELD